MRNVPKSVSVSVSMPACLDAASVDEAESGKRAEKKNAANWAGMGWAVAGSHLILLYLDRTLTATATATGE